MGGLCVGGLTRLVRREDGVVHPVVKDVSFVVLPGRCTGVTGPVSDGGRALLRLVAELDPRTTGKIELLRRPDEPPIPDDDPAFRRQEAPLATSFAPLLDRGVAEALREIRSFGATRRRRVVPPGPAELSAVADVRGTDPNSWSAAERVRLCVALAWSLRPRVLLLDLPGTGGPAAERRALVALLRRVMDAGIGLLVATQDERLLAATARTVLLLFDGVTTAEGPPEEVLPAACAAWQAEERAS